PPIHASTLFLHDALPISAFLASPLLTVATHALLVLDFRTHLGDDIASLFVELGERGTALIVNGNSRLQDGLGDRPHQRFEHGRQDRKSTRLNSSHVKISY